MMDEKFILEIKDLLKIPDIGQALMHKVEELKLILSRDMEKYRRMTEKLIPRKLPFAAEGIEFELHRLDENLWIPFIPGRGERNAYNILPRPVIEYIVDYPMEKSVINMKPGVRLAAFNEKAYDLSFEKINDSLINGAISERIFERREENAGWILPDSQLTNIDTHELEEGTEKTEEINLLLYYMLNYNQYYQHVISEFFYRWKPLLDSKLIPESSNTGQT